MAFHPGEEATDPGQRRTRSDEVAAVLVVVAAAIHIVLLPEHLAESWLFGAVFATIALFQLGIGWALWTLPGPRVRAAGRFGSLAIVALFLGARVFAPPGQAVPEGVTWIGVSSLILEIAAVAALAVVLPVTASRQRRARSLWLPAVAAGSTFFLLELVASGDLRYTHEAFARPDSMWVYANGINNLSPALVALVGHHWSLFLPLVGTTLSLLVAGLLTAAVRLTLEVARLQPHCSARLGLLGAVPASLAAPVCCGPSLLAAVGAGAAAALGWLATPVLLLSAALLGLDILWLRRCMRAVPGPPGSPASGARKAAA